MNTPGKAQQGAGQHTSKAAGSGPHTTTVEPVAHADPEPIAEPIPAGLSLVETFDAIRRLRQEAQEALDRDRYDPCGHTDRHARDLRNQAEAMEQDMESRLGWRRS